MTTPDPFAPGYRLTDGNQLNQVTSNPVWSVTESLSATVGGIMQTSVKIVNAVTNITNAAAPGAGVTLPQALQGTILFLNNNSANDVRVFAAGGSTIDGLDGQIGILLAKGTAGVFCATATKQWSQLNTTNSAGLTVIPNIAVLRLTSVSVSSFVLVEGYYASGDGGAGNFYGVTGAAPGTYVDNGGTIIVPTGGNGSSAWIRDYSNYIDPRWFGINFTSDGSKVAFNTTQWQVLVNYMGSNGGGTIECPAGGCWINGAINVPGAVTIQGAGREATIFLCASKTFFAFILGDRSNGSGGWVSCFRANIRAVGIHSAALGVLLGYESALCSITDVSFLSCTTGIVVRGDKTVAPVVSCINHLIRDCEISGHDLGIQTYECDEIYIQNVLPNSGTTNCQHIVIDTATAGVHMTDINATGGDYPLVFQNSRGLSPNPNNFDPRPAWVWAARCLGDSANIAGMRILAGVQLHFFDCWASGSSGWGVILGESGSNSVSDIAFVGGFYCFNEKEAFFVTNPQQYLNLVIAGGTVIHGNSRSTPGAYSSIRISAGSIGVSLSELMADAGNPTPPKLSYPNNVAYTLYLEDGASDYISVLPNCKFFL